MVNTSQIREARFLQRWSQAGAILSPTAQKMSRLNLSQKLERFTQFLFDPSKDGNSIIRDTINAFRPEVTGKSSSILGFSSQRLRLNFFRYKITPEKLLELTDILKNKGFKQIGFIPKTISVMRFPNSQLCVALEVDPNRADTSLSLAAIGVVSKTPADYEAIGRNLNTNPGGRKFGDITALKFIRPFSLGIDLEAISPSLAEIWQAVDRARTR